jgi:CBS domain containing-hemolysin-like protein
MIKHIVLISVIVLSIVLAGLFNGAETGIYQLSRLRLRLGIEKKRLSFALLGKIMYDSPGLLLSMLIGTNLAHYLATSIVTFLLLSKLEVEHTAALLATVIAAPTLFIFSEVIPKSIFFYRSDSLMPYLAPVLFGFHKLFSWCGLVPLLKNLSRIFAQLTGAHPPAGATITAVQRPHIRAILRDTREEDILSSVQTDIINRVTIISHLSIRSVMTPISKVQTVDINSDKSALLKKLERTTFTRLPVVDQQPANIIGFINIYETLSSPEQFTDLHNFIKPIRKLHPDTTVSDAINIMQSENQKIILVTRASHVGREKPIGIVTMKDLVEELLGELAEW